MEPKNTIAIKTNISGNRISYKYHASGPWREAFNIDKIEGWFGVVGGGVHEFFVEYDENMESVPESIAVIPFLCNVLPIAWVYDAEVIVPQLDEDFYNSVPGFKRGYIGMYPEASLEGKLTAGKLVKNTLSPNANGSLAFFSGGVDANFTLLSNLQKKPLLMTLWGSDIFFTQTNEWGTVSEQNRRVARSLGLQYAPVKSSFRFFLNYDVLDAKFAKPSGASSWWHGFQHGIGLISHAAPLAWKRGITQIYIASSYSIYDDQTTKCASWPTIDEFVRFSSCLVTHHNFRCTRQDKIQEICKISKEYRVPVRLRVCWQSGQAQNCCRCEKCVRTIFGVLAEASNPQNFGFNTDAQTYAEIEKLIAEGKIKPTKFWTQIVEKLQTNAWLMENASYVRTLVRAYRAAAESGRLY